MALGKKRIVAQKSNLKHRRGVEERGLGLELELAQYKKGFGMKRTLVSDTGDSIFTSPVRKISSKKLSSASCQSGELEDLHLDILVSFISNSFSLLFWDSKSYWNWECLLFSSHFDSWVLFLSWYFIRIYRVLSNWVESFVFFRSKILLAQQENFQNFIVDFITNSLFFIYYYFIISVSSWMLIYWAENRNVKISGFILLWSLDSLKLVGIW